MIDSVEYDVFDMKRLYAVVAFALILAVPMLGSNSLIASDGGGGSRHGQGQSTVGGGTNNDIPSAILNYVLEMAAPQFGVTAKFLKRKYYGGFVTVVQVGPSTYAVTYGGITIQILIESGSADYGGMSAGVRGARF